jgi:hypothetical protein
MSILELELEMGKIKRTRSSGVSWRYHEIQNLYGNLGSGIGNGENKFLVFSLIIINLAANLYYL